MLRRPLGRRAVRARRLNYSRRETKLESRSWFITGTSRGFGRTWATAALERGDRVVGTARKRDAMADLVAAYPERMLALELDP